MGDMAQELTARDDALLTAAANGMSPDEMEQELGLPAAKAAARVKEILAANDIWTDIERRQLLMHDLYKIKTKIQQQLQNYIDDKLGEVLLKTIKTIDEILDKTGKVTDEQLTKISRAQAGAMLQLIKAAFDAAKTALIEQHPEVDIQIIDEVFNKALIEKATEIQE